YGPSDTIFGGVYLGIVAWCVLLLLIGVRAVHGWTWARSAAAVALAGAFPALIGAAATLSAPSARQTHAPPAASRTCAAPPGTRRSAPRPHSGRAPRRSR